jgi:hypothetical protein
MVYHFIDRLAETPEWICCGIERINLVIAYRGGCQYHVTPRFTPGGGFTEVEIWPGPMITV